MRLAHTALMHRWLTPLSVVLLVAGCGGSSPTEPSPTGGATSSVLQGQTVNAIDGAPVPNLSVRIGTSFPLTTTSDGSGFFQVDVSAQSVHRTVVSGASVVERETRMGGPGSGRARVSMIPSTFDLRAFDEMFRGSNARLQRWTSRPALVILAAVMEYRGNTSGQTYDATGEQLTDDEIAQLQTHLQDGLAFLSGGVFTSFASVEVERPAGGTRVNTLRTGQIVVGRYKGITKFANTIGYGVWSELPDGAIAGGAMYLDREFDREDNRRRLLRIHELGHALGYQHVESRTSIMNPAIGPEPTEFDRAGAIIAFERPVGNRSPDIDPSIALTVSTGEGRWVAPRTACGLGGS
jgi:Matrixin